MTGHRGGRDSPARDGGDGGDCGDGGRRPEKEASCPTDLGYWIDRTGHGGGRDSPALEVGDGGDGSTSKRGRIGEGADIKKKSCDEVGVADSLDGARAGGADTTPRSPSKEVPQNSALPTRSRILPG